MKIPDIFIPEKNLEKKLNKLMEPKHIIYDLPKDWNVDNIKFYINILQKQSYTKVHDF